MNFTRSVAMAFSMFSKIPTPHVKWEKQNMHAILAAFPLVGVVIGLCLWLWCRIASALGLGAPLFAAGLTLLPLLLSGGIHMDGFCDTADALASHAPPAKKREILKDTHVGAFAVISTGAYLLLYFALCAELDRGVRLGLFVGLIPVMSRSVSGLASLRFPSGGTGGLLDTFRASADKRSGTAVLTAFFLLCALALFLLDFWAGAAMTAAAALCGVYVYYMSKKQFGGMSGDISGYLLQLTELAMLLALVIYQKAVMR